MCRDRTGVRLPILCIVPPHILKHIALGRTRETRRLAAWALHTLALSERVRGARAALGPIATLAATPAVTKRRTVYDAGHTERLPGKLVRREGDAPVRDPSVNEAYDGAGDTYDFYLEAYGRNSIDDRGMGLDSSVHYGREFDNAFWDGRQMVYGDGDGTIFGRFTKCIEIIGHELTHGVTEYEARLDYRDQPGALNESFSDVFGSLVKQKKLGQDAAAADWLIGAGLFAPGVKGVALRSMKAPGTAYDDPRIGKDPQPAHMKDFVSTHEDNGGVHINSGIPNHAFYLAATAIGGRAWTKAGRVWYLALRDRLRPDAQFADAARETAALAIELFGAGGREARAVAAAWDEVGVAATAAGRRTGAHAHRVRAVGRVRRHQPAARRRKRRAPRRRA
jgi:Zn-dependent metalloprotease